MATTISRARPGGKFEQIPHSTLKDTRISFRALGLLSRLLSLADGETITSADLGAGLAREGREAIRTALRELEATGYLQRNKLHDVAGRWSTNLVVHSTPCRAFAADQPTPKQRMSPPRPEKSPRRPNDPPKVARATEPRKIMRTRESGIVCWLDDDVQQAELIESTSTAVELAKAVAALGDKSPVPGRVNAEIQRRRTAALAAARKQESEATGAVARAREAAAARAAREADSEAAARGRKAMRDAASRLGIK